VPPKEKKKEKMYSIYIMEFYSAVKKDEIISFAGNWITVK
jgi:hypothetical protein